MKWRNTFTEAISVILIQENCFSEYIWFIMKLEKQRTNLGVFVSTCTTGKSLLGTESKSQYTVERVWGMASLIWPAHSFILCLTCQVSSPFEITATACLLKKPPKVPVAGTVHLLSVQMWEQSITPLSACCFKHASDIRNWIREWEGLSLF